jgi:hypothetical protein
MKELENKLNELLVTKAPFQLPDGLKKWIAKYAWIFVLLSVILGAIAFLALLAGVGLVSAFGEPYGVNHFVFFSWLALLSLGSVLVIQAMSISPLKKLQKRGWQLTFLAALVNFAYNVVFSISSGRVIVSGLIWDVIWFIVTLYFIFQVRSQFKGADSAPAKK